PANQAGVSLLVRAFNSDTAQISSVRKTRATYFRQPENAFMWQLIDADINTKRKLTRNAAKPTAVQLAGWVQISIATNCEPPAKTSALIITTSSVERPVFSATAP